MIDSWDMLLIGRQACGRALPLCLSDLYFI